MQAFRHIARCAAVLALLAASLASCDLDQPQAQAPVAQAPAGSAASTVPTPTFVPLTSVQPPQFEASSPLASASLAPAPLASASLASAPLAVAQTLLLDDDAWLGGWKQSRTYGGRSATWIYGTGTEYTTMQATFELAGQPSGAARLSIEGMDGENAPKMNIQILVNGSVIYSGDNPFPDDDYSIDTGNWATYFWPFEAALLQPGANTITIVALSPGGVGQPPFMMLDYAELIIGE